MGLLPQARNSWSCLADGAAQRSVGLAACRVSQHRQEHRDGKEERQRDTQRPIALHLSLLGLAAGLEGFEELFDDPPCAIGVDHRGDLLWS
jgi:hypothetical protein